MLYNFFLIDKKDGTYCYLLTIYGDNDDEIIEEDINWKFNKFDYTEFINYVESFAKYNDNVYIEIVDNDLVEKDGIGRFWCNVNEKTYDMSYEEDWNTYVNYKKKKW